MVFLRVDSSTPSVLFSLWSTAQATSNLRQHHNLVQGLRQWERKGNNKEEILPQAPLRTLLVTERERQPVRELEQVRRQEVTKGPKVALVPRMSRFPHLLPIHLNSYSSLRNYSSRQLRQL